MKNVLILFGGNSFEHEISCRSVNFIIDNIDTNLFNYKLVGIDFDSSWYEIIETKKIDALWMNNIRKKIDNIIEYAKEFDVVFPMIHGNDGEDGKLQSLFELFNINYVGCDFYTSLVCYDKLLTKLVLEKYNIPQVPYLVYGKEMNFDKVDFPVIIKPCKCGSSIGINVAHNKKELSKHIKSASKYDNNIVIEKFIENNRELECAVLQKKKKLIISNIGEIVNDGSWYDYDSKYVNSTSTVISDIDDSIKKEIQEYSKKIFNVLNCKGFSRLDFLFDSNSNKLYFNEINTIPGFTEISMYPKLIKKSGINYKDLITAILK